MKCLKCRSVKLTVTPHYDEESGENEPAKT
jgi:hypothetical protein